MHHSSHLMSQLHQFVNVVNCVWPRWNGHESFLVCNLGNGVPTYDKEYDFMTVVIRLLVWAVFCANSGFLYWYRVHFCTSNRFIPALLENYKLDIFYCHIKHFSAVNHNILTHLFATAFYCLRKGGRIKCSSILIWSCDLTTIKIDY